jgi:hypothetical protein
LPSPFVTIIIIVIVVVIVIVRHHRHRPGTTPQVFFEGSYRPICSHGFADDHNGATEVCRALGYPHGGMVRKTGTVFDTDAVVTTTVGTNGDVSSPVVVVSSVAGNCRAGNAVGVDITCYHQCRKFDTFDDKVLESCHPYLRNTSTYYLADVAWLDDIDGPPGFSIISQFANIFHAVMNDNCAVNVVAHICHGIFKECKEVEDVETGLSMYLPSLLCRDECDTRLAKWDSCVAQIGTDAPSKANFDTQMQEIATTMGFATLLMHPGGIPLGPTGVPDPFRMLACDAPGGDLDAIAPEDSAISLALGQYPFPESYWGTLGVAWPAGMATEALYPTISSLYIHPGLGRTYDVPCFVPGEEKDTALVKCPSGFVHPVAENHLLNCIKPCPVQAYTNSEYNNMWAVASVVGVIGLCLNVFMALTWVLSGARAFRKVPSELKVCVMGGILYGVVETLPALFLKYVPIVGVIIVVIAYHYYCYCFFFGYCC